MSCVEKEKKGVKTARCSCWPCPAEQGCLGVSASSSLSFPQHTHGGGTIIPIYRWENQGSGSELMSSLLHSHWQQSLAGTQARLTPAIRTTAKVRAREDPESLQRDASWLPNYRCNCRILPFPFFLAFVIFSIQSKWTLDVSRVCFGLQRATQTLQLAQLLGLWINASSGTILL